MVWTVFNLKREKKAKNHYTADGEKTLTKRYVNNNFNWEEQISIYLGNVELKNGNFHALNHEEGRLLKDDNGNMHEEYFIKDHLGNIRVRFEDSDEDVEIQYEFPVDNEYEESELIFSHHYYPFGMEWKGHFYANPDTEVQRKRFNGKEYEEGLGLLDYGARWYDPVVGRWDVVDPMADKMPEWSTYNYTFNNPIRFIDPDGTVPSDPPKGGYGTNGMYAVAEHMRQVFQDVATTIDNWGTKASHTYSEIIGKKTPISTTKLNHETSLNAGTNFAQIFDRHGASNSPVIDKPLVTINSSESTSISTETEVKVGKVEVANVKSQDLDDGEKTNETSLSIGYKSGKVSFYDSEITNDDGTKKDKSGVKGSITIPGQNNTEHKFEIKAYHEDRQ